MKAELGPDWQSKFQRFEQEASAAASLGQVHKAVTLDGQDIACKLQYPDMKSAIEADLKQLKIIFSIFEFVINMRLFFHFTNNLMHSLN